jgi:hypothetical protein
VRPADRTAGAWCDADGPMQAGDSRRTRIPVSSADPTARSAAVEIFLFWFVASIVVGIWAGNRGRNGAGWCLLSLLISPLLTFLILLVIGKNEQAVEAEAIETGGMRKCPMCAELVKREAVKCKHCGSEMAPA